MALCLPEDRYWNSQTLWKMNKRDLHPTRSAPSKLEYMKSRIMANIIITIDTSRCYIREERRELRQNDEHFFSETDMYKNNM